jgi:hypothetical protein
MYYINAPLLQAEQNGPAMLISQLWVEQNGQNHSTDLPVPHLP